LNLFLEKVVSFIPESSTDVESLKWHLGLNKYQVQIFSRVHKVQRIAWAPEMPLKDLLRKSLSALFESHAVDKSLIKYVIYAHTIQTVAPFPMNPLRELQSEFGLAHAMGFSMTMQNCASSVGALEVSRRLLEASDDPSDKVLILTGEKAFSPSVQLIPSTTIMGDASAACLVGREGTHDRILAVREVTEGRFSRGIALEPAVLREFENLYVPTLAKTMQMALDDAKLSLDQIGIVIPHNINISSWKRVARDLNLPMEKIYLENVSKFGHCFCSDIFINHGAARRDQRLKPGDYYLMVGVGLGATFAVGVLQH
jgi:3-oxoacyl-[acyl-carrier-protein] synthase III